MNHTNDAERTALVLVDYQSRLMPAIHQGAEAVAQAVRLGSVARALGIPVLGTEQNPTRLGRNDAAVQALCQPMLAKMHFDACAEGLVDAVRSARTPAPSEVVVAGCETHVCLLQTALSLLRAGLRVWVAADACGSRRASDHELALQRLRAAGVGIVSVEMVAFEWLRHCQHERFKAVLPLLKQV